MNKSGGPPGWIEKMTADLEDSGAIIEDLRAMLTRSGAGIQLVITERNHYRAGIQDIADNVFTSRGEVRALAKKILKETK
jgi:hypothetical protein